MLSLQWDIQSGGERSIHARVVQHKAGQGWALHQHDYIECFCVDEGSLHHQHNGVSSELVPGDLVALLPGERHAATAGPAGAQIIKGLDKFRGIQMM